MNVPPRRIARVVIRQPYFADTAIYEGGRFEHERHDCVVGTMVHASGKDYTTCHAEVAKLGRKDRRGMHFHKVVAKAENFGIKMEPVKGFQKGKTVSYYQQKYKLGTFVFSVRGHVFPLINGMIYDRFPIGKRVKVRALYEVTPIG